MIAHKAGVFRLTTNHSSYWFRVTAFGHLEQVYYGARLDEQPIEALLLKRTAATGSSIVYNAADPLYVLDNIPLNWSGAGRGDYRYSPAELKMPDGSFTHDFVYTGHVITPGVVPMTCLPGAYMPETYMPATYLPEASSEEHAIQTLCMTLRDQSNHVELQLIYTVFPACDIITRRAVIINCHEKALVIRRMLSMMMDLPDRDYQLITFDGNWIKEAQAHTRRIAPGMYVNASTTGASSNQHNPGFLLAEGKADEDSGNVYGFNLIYSGNHFGFVERNAYDLVRVGIGINPHCFEWTLAQNERFETPEAVLSFSNQGFNGLSHHFHDFVNEHIVRGDWKGRERPVLFNNWESHFFKFNQRKLLKLARGAKKLGAELFVLDDGWFKGRDNDSVGLGDYAVNRRKLPYGLPRFMKRIRKMGLQCGLWFEPEMVNEDSDLFRAHPTYAVCVPGKPPVHGRNQLVLDLCNDNVRDYIVENVSRILDDCGITYVKWDMNRHIAEAYSPQLQNQGEFYHRYILGLYDILQRIFRPRPHILLESCASGGNRFDLGMLCYSPQIWASDNTDPVSRLSIQGGLSYLYPLSTMGAHVSAAPHQQTLRATPLCTRYHVACFGVLGYELDIKHLTPMEKKELREQIAFYKQHRKTLQYGRFDRLRSDRNNQFFWQCTEPDGDKAITGFFQGVAETASGHSILRVPYLNEEARFVVQTKPQRLFIKRFGGLVKHILPVELNPDGFILRMANRRFALNDCVERYEADGRLLSYGILLNNQFMGSYYNEHTELLGDFGSYLFLTRMQDGKAV